jgi:hypothetical protein
MVSGWSAISRRQALADLPALQGADIDRGDGTGWFQPSA